MNKRVAYFLGALVMAAVGLVPVKASAGWGWWGGPGIIITIAPRWGSGYYGYRPYGYYGYSGYPYYGYRHYGYRHYGYRRYGYYSRLGHCARHSHRRWH